MPYSPIPKNDVPPGSRLTEDCPMRRWDVLHPDGSVTNLAAPTAQDAMIRAQRVSGLVAVRVSAESPLISQTDWSLKGFPDAHR